ncbi:uncharacterized protein LAESUDRAFT_728468 [Laetiporus sulphureus 93-53]|uniref:Trafficking protein particle complex II-specific subunit 65 IgD3 domain-containing protein n=1 Tax=Laetiporus sulphureus 93-53 TaxID=1314785 RepID=A0A165D678_9APHY|nr:uncharacterized protein LAESUDRAFT_728468 [Laetiporus sulphureus 93-53]KZT04225.1 hypothetical protein LAESUDRAFT_728468 [Laetiporus sulphureus 93-53]
MATFEELFNSNVLEVIAPQTSLEFPAGYTGDRATEWLSRLRADPTDRKVAFFDENIDLLLIIRFPTSGIDTERSDGGKPPMHLLSFLAHLQIAYDASYISPSAPPVNVPEIQRPPIPLRTTSMNQVKPAALLAVSHPSIFPPSTPHPIPSAAESDRQYVQAQGTPLSSGIWGEQKIARARESSDAFALLWNDQNDEWVAVYRMSVLVRFMNTRFPDPLLSLTVSATLREKALPVTPARRTLSSMIEEAGGLPGLVNPMSPARPSGIVGKEDEDDELLLGLEEINLLEGLQADPTFTSSDDPPLNLPSTRLGPKTRHDAFSLPPVPPSSASSQHHGARPPSSYGKPSHMVAGATFRKSYRKTMKVVSGFHVRMRTVFVPHFLLPRNGKSKQQLTDGNGSKVTAAADSEDEEDEYAREQRETGNEEHTVILSVEIENSFPDTPADSLLNFSFEIERADVTVSGTGAKTVLVSWGDNDTVFPLYIAPREQVNLLYAVSFLRGPELDECPVPPPSGPRAGSRTSLSAAGKRGSMQTAASSQDMHRSVSINISVRPFERAPESETITYPTKVYKSYWSCKLNFSSALTIPSAAPSEADPTELTVLPTPASPFPTVPASAPPTVTSPPASRPMSLQGQSVAGNKRYTLSALESPASASQVRKAKSPVNYQGPTAMLNPANQPQLPAQGPMTPTSSPTSGGMLNVPGNRGSLPPSVGLQSLYARSPAPTTTTYDMPAPDTYFSFSALGAGSAGQVTGFPIVEEPGTPRTPAYPAYPGSPLPVPPTPFWQAPLSQQNASAPGPSVDMRRDRQSILPTPGVNVLGFPTSAELGAEVEAEAEAGAEPIIVSVGLLSTARESKSKSRRDGEIYPLDQFTLDIFVFNQSSWTRRFEVSHPDERRRRRKGRTEKRKKGAIDGPGIVPLENRVRIGPLLPSTCQSVRMDFLALTPGVHPIDELVLTDVQSGYTMHLRSVIDVVVHEPPVEPTEPS